MNVYKLKVTDFRPQQDWLYRILFAAGTEFIVVGSEGTLHRAFKAIQEIALMGHNPNECVTTWDHERLVWSLSRNHQAPGVWPEPLVQIDVELLPVGD